MNEHMLVEGCVVTMSFISQACFVKLPDSRKEVGDQYQCKILPKLVCIYVPCQWSNVPFIHGKVHEQ